MKKTTEINYVKFLEELKKSDKNLKNFEAVDKAFSKAVELLGEPENKQEIKDLCLFVLPSVSKYITWSFDFATMDNDENDEGIYISVDLENNCPKITKVLVRDVLGFEGVQGNTYFIKGANMESINCKLLEILNG